MRVRSLTTAATGRATRAARPIMSLSAVCGVVAVCLAVTLASSSTAAETPTTYVACGLSRDARPSHVCHLTNSDEFGAFFQSATETTYTVCVEFPTRKELCAEAQHADAGTLYVNKITSNITGPHRVTWLVEGQPVGTWSFRIPVDPPVFGKTATLRAVSGTVLIRGPREHEFVPLTGVSSVRLGTVVDTRDGVVRLQSVASPGGGIQTGRFHGDVFKIGQTKVRSRFLGGRSALTVLKLVGKLEGCGQGGRPASAARRPRRAARRHRSKGRGLWGNAHGNFRTGGRYASTTVRGTKWLVEDTCSGTRVRVARGLVSVRDFHRHRTTLLRAHHGYLARRGGNG
jgi:hypothetical protein